MDSAFVESSLSRNHGIWAITTWFQKWRAYEWCFVFFLFHCSVVCYFLEAFKWNNNSTHACWILNYFSQLGATCLGWLSFISYPMRAHRIIVKYYIQCSVMKWKDIFLSLWNHPILQSVIAPHSCKNRLDVHFSCFHQELKLKHIQGYHICGLKWQQTIIQVWSCFSVISDISPIELLE